MPTLSENISASLDLCQAVSSVKYPNLIGKTGRIINGIARAMMREARLSDQNQYLNFLALTSPQKEQMVPSITDPSSICTVELLTDSVNDTRRDIQIVEREDLNAQIGLACARFGNPTRLRFTWNPATQPISGLGSDTIYVGYEVLPPDAGLTDIPNLPESFHDCLQYRAAGIVSERILGQVNGPVFLDTMRIIEQQWEEWCKRNAEERPVISPGFGDLDADDSFGVWF